MTFDSVRFHLHVGAWSDAFEDGQTELPPAVVLNLQGYDVDVISLPEIRQQMFDWGWTPWADERRESSYYANASGSTLDVAVSVLPVVQDALITGSAAMLADHLLRQVLSLIRVVFPRNDSVTLDTATEMAQSHLLWNTGAALPDLRQIEATREDDGSFRFTYRNVRLRRDYVLRIDSRGVMGYADIQEVEAFRRRRDAKTPRN